MALKGHTHTGDRRPQWRTCGEAHMLLLPTFTGKCFYNFHMRMYGYGIDHGYVSGLPNIFSPGRNKHGD
eukprot:scaffold96923_cov47-Attheya_sp.AAC.1